MSGIGERCCPNKARCHMVNSEAGSLMIPCRRETSYSRGLLLVLIKMVLRTAQILNAVMAQKLQTAAYSGIVTTKLLIVGFSTESYT